jgi:ketosteroid isomerase-like protein
MTPQAADDAFFAALVAGDAARLDSLLAEDFLIVDIAGGGVTPRDVFLDAVRSGALRFAAIDPEGESDVRRYDGTAIVVGATRMRGAFGGEAFAAHSRYTHVFVRRPDGWRLASAQGTPIAAPS